jgi:hypothetical protein
MQDHLDRSPQQPDRRSRSSRSRSRTAVGGALSALVLAASLTACSHTSPPSPTPSPSASSTPVKALGPTRVRITQSHHRLPKSVRVVLGRRIGKVIDGWWNVAYLGTYPRTKASFANSFAGFTPAARKLAMAKPATMTNEELAAASSVTVVKRWINLDVLGLKNVPVGVAADCHLLFSATTSSGSHRYAVHARVELTKTKGVWRIFAFAVQKGTVAPGSGTPASGAPASGAPASGGPKSGSKQSKGAGR